MINGAFIIFIIATVGALWLWAQRDRQPLTPHEIKRWTKRLIRGEVIEHRGFYYHAMPYKHGHYAVFATPLEDLGRGEHIALIVYGSLCDPYGTPV